jgi:glycosyltransferase involved in cell wall biosynthesis
MTNDRNIEFLTIILPVFNNNGQLLELVDRINRQFQILDLDGEILVIDDGSEPDTWNLILQLTSSFKRARGIRFSRNFGQHAAIKAGLEFGRGTCFVLMDADLENRPEDIPKLVATLRSSQNEIALGRWQNSHQKRPFSRTFHRLIAAGNYDPQQLVGAATFRIFTRKIRDELLKYGEQGPVFGPLMHQLGFRFDLVDVERDASSAPKSRYGLARRLRLAKPLLATFLLGAALRFFVSIGAIAISVALVVSAVVVFRFAVAGGDLASTNAIYGLLVASLVAYIGLGMSVLIFVSNLILGEVRKRPSYHIAEITDSQVG